MQKLQHRYLLPLVGDTVKAMLRQPRHPGVGLLMHTALNAPIFSARALLSPDTYRALKANHRPIVNGREIIEEHARTLAQLLLPQFIEPPIGVPQPTTISVSSVLPPELMGDAMDKHFASA
ncbi:hypothetical protein HK414_22500 [Ramlibacter terrae]|uniref:Uncharacterized protein n=1 Tax=Ramlibacter terrae TaxID=2732511 RepID=A0ABX6P568_9BURK|nr:hypothetical protein HK414_22500 [Ramlibacter terrae]